jgi:3-methyladenine DNA glycosylase/8-oxoguanine DNA glycosylase
MMSIDDFALKLVVPTASAFDLRATVSAYGAVQLTPWAWHPEIGVLRRAERFSDGSIALLTFEQEGPHLKVTVSGANVSAEEAAWRLARIVQANVSFDGFQQLCESEEALAPITAQGLGRMLRSPSLFEDTVKAICWTNITWPQAVKATNLLGVLGDECPGRDLRAFPTAEQILGGGLAYLTDVCRLGYRAAYIIELADRVSSGALDLEALEREAPTLSTRDLMKRLLAMKGVGRASATYLLHMLGRYDEVYVDTAVLGFLSRHFYEGRRPTEREARETFARYGEWRGLVAWFLQHVKEWQT